MSEKKPASFRQLAPTVKPLRRSRVAAGDEIARTPPAGDLSPAEPLTRLVVHVDTGSGVVAGHAEGVPVSAALSLARGPGRPYRTLDLHRMTAPEARSALRIFVRQARAARIRFLVVVCGRGLHSGPVGPVLPELVVEELAGPLCRHVLAFRTAPSSHGGEGAFVVRLRA